MKKILLLIISTLIVGCSAEYTIIMDEKTIKEELNVFISEAEYNEMDEIEIANTISDFERGYEFYNREELLESVDKIGYKYTYNNSFEHFATESQASRCYDEVNIISDKTIRVETSKYFGCYDLNENLDEVVIKIKTKNKVIDNNADSVRGITYTWHINKDNYENKPIIIEISTEKNEVNKVLIYIVTGIVVFLIIALLLVRKIKKANSV